MQLRDYQTEAIHKLKQSLKAGHTAPILRLDCGAGKTVIACSIAESMVKKGTKLLFLVHRQELLKQTIDTFNNAGINNQNIAVGMVITVSHNLDKYDPDVIICDECNFALSKTWRTVLDAYPKAIKIGLSATPVRLSGEPMGDVFDDILEVISAQELIKRKYLCEYDYYAPKINFDISEIKKRCGDYNAEQIATALDKPKIYGDVLAHYKKLADGRKTIVYCATVKHSEDTAEQFRQAGYNAAHFEANTKDIDRKQIIADFKSGKITILCNVDLVSFGFNCPDCDCIVLLRPTCSISLFIQQSCRALRGREGKRAIILDFVNNVNRHGLPTETREWSLTGRITCKNESADPDILVRQCKNCLRVYSGTGRICPYCGEEQPKTRREIEQDEKAELERIEKIERRNKRKEQGRAETLEELIAIGHSRGYKNPVFWARMVYNSRTKK